MHFTPSEAQTKGIFGLSGVPSFFSPVTTALFSIMARAITNGSACELVFLESTSRLNCRRTSFAANWISVVSGILRLLCPFAHSKTESSYFDSSTNTSAGATISPFSMVNSIFPQSVINVFGGYVRTRPSNIALVSRQYNVAPLTP